MGEPRATVDPRSQGTDAAAYLIDAWQRSILTWDVLRERGNQSLAHIQSGKPPVLVFDYETVLDGRTLPRPANYALLRVKPGAGHPPTDPRKRPFVVIDPRAGHGPGIGGFKIDSQVGIALKKGHPCYFVTFAPSPSRGRRSNRSRPPRSPSWPRCTSCTPRRRDRPSRSETARGAGP